jgi:hypothetical protein
VSGALDGFVRSAPWPQRLGLLVLLTVGRRPRGMALLSRLAPADQLASSLLALERYDDPATGRALGWDAAAVVAHGRELRRAEGRP